MYKSRVVTGRIIEIHGDRVLTQQGDMICTYHSRYYTMPEAEDWTQAECDLDEDSIMKLQDKSANQI